MSYLLVLHQFGVDFGKYRYSHRPGKMRQRGCRFGFGALGRLFSQGLKSVDSLVYSAPPLGGLSRYLTHTVSNTELMMRFSKPEPLLVSVSQVPW